MLAELARAALAAVAAGVLPGYFWAAVLCPASGFAERFAYSTLLSMASVPVLAILLARLTGAGVTLRVALGSVAVVLGSGALAFVVRGAASQPARPVLPRPPKIRGTATLVLVALALAVALAIVVHPPASGALLVAAAAALAIAGALAVRATGPVWAAEPAGPAGPAGEDGSGPAGPAEADGSGPAGRAGLAGQRDRGTLAQRAWQQLALAAVVALILIRAYVPVIRYDWPYIRGSDQFSYVVMMQQMLSHGSYSDFMTYPPGFPTMAAVVSRSPA